MIYQTHEKHGRHIAISPTEAEVNQKSGWLTVSEAEFYGITTGAVAVSREQLAVEYKERFGKKPHPKMKIENMRKALDGGSE